MSESARWSSFLGRLARALRLLATTSVSPALGASITLGAVVGPAPVEVQGVQARGLCEAAAAGLRDMRSAVAPGVDERLRRCRQLAEKALGLGLGVEGAAHAIVIAYNESNFRPEALGRAGEQGMMQVLGARHCPTIGQQVESCDHDQAALVFLRALVDQARRIHPRRVDWVRVLRGYNGSRRYALKVAPWARHLLGRHRRLVAKQAPVVEPEVVVNAEAAPPPGQGGPVDAVREERGVR